MNTEKMTAEIKTRVPKLAKSRLNAIAAARHLDLSDIVRQALREFISKPENAVVKNGKAVS